MALPLQRIDLLPQGKVPAWKAQYPVGRSISMHDLNGDEKNYLVKSIDVEADPVFHPDTSEAFYRCTATLQLQ